MMFSCGNPRLAEEAQIALVLHILCGFSVNKIANAFVSNDAAIGKRRSRAKKTLAGTFRGAFRPCGEHFSVRIRTLVHPMRNR